MDIVFKGRHTDVLERFRKHATAKLARLEKLDHKAMRVDVEVMTERNPRQSDRKERVELTITTRGPAIRAEAAAEDRFAAMDLALAKLESRLRRACDRRKDRHATGRPGERTDTVADQSLGYGALVDEPVLAASAADASRPAVPMSRAAAEDDRAAASPQTPQIPDSGPSTDTIIAIETRGEGQLLVREKMHVARPMTIDQALFEMELVGHDFFLFTDAADGLPSVVYKRRGYQYGVIRLVEEDADTPADHAAGLANGRARRTANLASG
jgi:ribosomal subunit interface protein